ncbi:unnamed protein product [Somion occarium]|uniref:Uncharacterized protein n=1 Tax=Somion occarium TaxID=3059160 RepID=A0ABP1DAB3_9APHY
MADDVLGTLDALPPTHSSPSMPSEDEDAVNTESARVYFGPVTSPEKKFVRKHDRERRTPIRRSKRLSTAPLLLQRANLQDLQPSDGTAEDGTSDQSETETPGPDAFEEPSSVLASKILRASVNPSPPPRSPSPAFAADAVETNENEDPLAQDESISPLLRSRQLDRESSSPVHSVGVEPLIPRPSSPLPEEQVVDSKGVDHDLIMFDTSDIADIPQVAVFPHTPPSVKEHQCQAGATTVDDLLFSSPLRPSPFSLVPSQNPERLQIPDTRSDVIHEEMSSSLDEEEQVFRALVTGQQSAAPSPLSDPSETSTAAPGPSLTPLIQIEGSPARESKSQVGNPEALTPLRRSSRPRRSHSPLVLPLTFNSPAKSAENNANDSAPIVVGPARRKSTKGKEREVLVEDDGPEDVTPGAPSAQIRRDTPPAEGHSSPRRPQRRSSSVHVRLNSLSPTSSGVLTQLLPTVSEANKTDADVPGQPTTDFPTLQTAPDVPNATSNDLTTSDTFFPSPSKPIDPAPTPARRIPIAQALRQGTISPKKPPLLLPPASFSSDVLASPAFRRVPLDDPNRSPAKRVPISDALASASKDTPGKPQSVSQLATPSRSIVFRSRSEEPQPLVGRKYERSTSLEPTRIAFPALNVSKDGLFRKLPEVSSVQRNRTLPYPIPRTPSCIPTSIPEGDESQDEPRASAAPIPSSTSKIGLSKPTSALRQPSSRAESKIPRIGAKPYNRQTPKPFTTKTTPKETKLHIQPVPPKPADSTAAPARHEQLIRMRKATGKPTASGSSSDDQNSASTAGPGPSTIANRAASGAIASHPEVLNLKRKRDEPTGRASPPGVKPIVVVRRVHSTTGATQKVPIMASPTRSPLKLRSPVKAPSVVQGKIKMRRAVGAKRPKAVTPSPSRLDKEKSSPSPPVIDVDSPGPQPVLGPITDQQPLIVPPVKLIEDTTDNQKGSEAATSETAQTTEDAPRGVRRTTRARKPSHPPADVFGTITAVEAPQPRRRTRAAIDSGAFSGMSALSLRSLTSANTQRNQNYVVRLETEVVRVEGKRPDSPTTKVRTVLERQKADRILQRQERAERRAKRTAEGQADVTAESVDFDEGDVSTVSAEPDSNGVILKYRRGPGEDEDYETPPRPDRPVKRGRFEEEDVQKKEEDALKDEKRVKWDRGLATTVYLRETPPKPARTHREETAKPGCLAPTAKTLRLDHLGNVLHVDAPLPGLVQEKITVKKFVYDDDVDPEPTPAPAKSTRSKSRKAKA